MRSLLLLGILILNIGAFAVQLSQKNSRGRRMMTDEEITQRGTKIILRGAAEFSGKFVQTIAQRDRNNFVVSSLGTSLVLSMVSLGARNESYAELRRILGLPERRKVGEKALRRIIDDLNSYKAVELEVANGLFPSSSYKIKDNFKSSIGRAFNTTITELNFTEGKVSSGIINEWCKEATHDRIQNIVGEDDLDGNTALVLVNALYFKGKWLQAFGAKHTRNQTFTLANGDTKEMKIMRALREVVYGEFKEGNIRVKFIELPYTKEDDADHNISMFIILPELATDFASLEANIHKITVEELLKRGKRQEVIIQLPRFKIESKFELNDPLKQMGMEKVFDEFKADFSGIFPSNGNIRLYIDKVIQKAFIEVNEAGSEAAAATVVYATLMSAQERQPMEFLADRPFYAIIGTTGKHRVNLFTARFTGQE